MITFDFSAILLFARSKPLRQRSTLCDLIPVLYIHGTHVSSEVLLLTIAEKKIKFSYSYIFINLDQIFGNLKCWTSEDS